MQQTLPVHPVDLEPLRLGGPRDRQRVAASVDAACRDSGFLVVTGHGVPQQICDDVLDAFAAFFDQPLEEKLRSTVADESANRGYSQIGKEALAYSRGESTAPDLFEAFNVGREDARGAYYETNRAFYAPNIWPTSPSDLHAAWSRYESAVARLADHLLGAMALALALPEDWFTDRCRRAILTTRALNYERAAGAPDPEPGQMRLGAHTDYGILTILLADQVPGLQVFRDDHWHDVPNPRGSFVCNIGDMLERWTNDRWTSTLHRVLPPASTADGPVRRRSLARFLDCEPDRIVSCIPSCCSDQDPPTYPPVHAGEWLRAKLLGGRTMADVDLAAAEVSAAEPTGS
ncbi:MAG: isopenicillin N synthase family oxygenase [Actinomycetota bacterium]|nr:isopenicillin N synthase family oxygenase [Actinomycetota bacterium]